MVFVQSVQGAIALMFDGEIVFVPMPSTIFDLTFDSTFS